MIRKSLSFVAAVAFSLAAVAAVDLVPEVRELQTEWARIKYELPEKERAAAFHALVEKAHDLSVANADRAEPLVWEAIILSSEAGASGGLGALSLVKKAKSLLEQAEQLQPDVLDGSVYTSLGSLYYQVPGWPLGFGDDDKAREYLLKALAVNPSGIDPHYFYGDFLMGQNDYVGAIEAFNKALAAPPREHRALADSGRRAEIRTALATAQRQLGQAD